VSGTLISHGFFVQHTGASQLSPPLAIGTLIQTMVEAAVCTLLVTATGVTSLFAANQLPAGIAAVPLSAIARAANKEHRAALQPDAKALAHRIFI
jgi:hypothetical protein